MAAGALGGAAYYTVSTQVRKTPLLEWAVTDRMKSPIGRLTFEDVTEVHVMITIAVTKAMNRLERAKAAGKPNVEVKQEIVTALVNLLLDQRYHFGKVFERCYARELSVSVTLRAAVQNFVEELLKEHIAAAGAAITAYYMLGYTKSVESAEEAVSKPDPAGPVQLLLDNAKKLISALQNIRRIADAVNQMSRIPKHTSAADAEIAHHINAHIHCTVAYIRSGLIDGIRSEKFRADRVDCLQKAKAWGNAMDKIFC